MRIFKNGIWLPFFVLALEIVAQNPVDSLVYKSYPGADASIIATAAGMNALAFISIKNLQPRTPSDLVGLAPGPLFGWDEQAISNQSGFAKTASNYLMLGSAVLPLAMFADKGIRSEARTVFIMGAQAGLIAHGLTLGTKRLVLRNRPYVFNPDVPISEKLANESRFSFFSGHTSMTATITFFTAKVWSDFHPDSRWKPVVWSAAAALPALTGYLRHRAGRHYFTDVAAGYGVGALVGYFVPHLHRRERREGRRHISVNSSFDGAMSLVFHCPLANSATKYAH
jgi:membrane-associated phospholipid phosphatase